MNRYIILSIVFLLAPALAGASEVTGTLSTGVSTGVQGTVVVAPIATPIAGTYASAQSIILAATGADSIRYTNDGSTPTCGTGALYTSAISVSSSLTIKAIACYPSDSVSTVASFAYVINIPAPATSGGGGGGGGSVSGGGGGGGGSVSGGGGGGGSLGGGQVLGASTSTVTTGSQGAATSTSVAPTGGSVGGSTGGQVLGAAVYNFAKNLSIGSRGADATELQKILIAGGFLKISAPTGYFGSATKSAVASYQKAHNINPASGYVGALTRAVLNGGTTPAASDEKASMIRKLQDQLKALLAKIAALTASNAITATSTNQ